jgi:DNA-binding SARP family transcriptional activator/Tfp pilus assembly protein PilF
VPVPPRLRALLAALLVQTGQIVTFTELAESVWGDNQSPVARATLRSYIKRLRQVMGPVAGARIVAHTTGYLIEVGEDELDLLRFGHLFQVGGAALRGGTWQRASYLLGEALGLWRGAPLADIPSEVLQRSEASRLEQLRLQALEWRIEADIHLGQSAALVPELQVLARQHPLREPFHAQLMLALYRCGRQAEALAAYQQARRILIAELGLEPGTDLQELHNRILVGDRGLTAQVGQVRLSAPQQLSAWNRQFTGRTSELRALTELLQGPAEPSGTVVIAAIDGPAGVGKTALALHWAHQVANRFPDGQLYLNLRGFDPSGTPVTTTQAVRSFLDAFNIPAEQIPAALDAQAALYRRLLLGKRVLVVLDNARNADHVRLLLPTNPGCLAVVTSRTQLASLAVDVGAHLITLDVLTMADASELLGRRIGAERIAREPAATAELVQLSARLPLALAIVAARASARPTFPIAALATEFRDIRGRLDALDAGSVTANVRTVFSWSYQQVSESAARMFRLLGLHPGPDSTVTAAASLADVPRDQARVELTELVRAHLLIEHAPVRYAFHDLLRAYAAEKAQEEENEEERRAAIGRMLDHYLHSSYTAALLLQPTREPLNLALPAAGVLTEVPVTYGEALTWFEAEHPALLASVRLASRMKFRTHAWQLAWCLVTFFDRRSYWADLVTAQQTGLSAAQQAGDQRGQAHSHRNLGRAYNRLGYYENAHVHLRHALGYYQQVDDQAGQARTSIDLALVSERQSQFGQALSYAQRALHLFQALGHRSGQADALNAVGWYRAQLGNYRHALASCEQALALHRDLGDRPGEAGTLDSIGYIHQHLGRHEEAIGCYRRALQLLRVLDDRFNQSGVLTHLGDAQHAAGDQRTALDSWQQALAILIDLQHPHAEQIRARLQGSMPPPGGG